MEMLRNRGADVALVTLAAVVTASTVMSGQPRTQAGGAVMALALLALTMRRRVSVLAAVAAFGLVAVTLHLVPHSPVSVFLAVLVCFAVSGTLATRRDAVVAWIAGSAVLFVSLVNSPATQGAGDIALTLTFCTIVWAAGLAATERGRQASAAHAHAERVESRRDLDVAAATSHERARIAGELHDIVSHGLSIVILQTVAARNALQDEPAPSDPAVDRRLEAVETVARQSLDEMRRLLDLLRLDEEGLVATREPAASLSGLPALVERTREAGQPVELSDTLVEVELPAGLDAAAYRIVQEALTNALKHAPGARTCVDIAGGDGALHLTVRTGAPTRPPQEPAGSGFGLVGMQERVRWYDGTLAAAPDGDGFRVEAVLPLRHSP